MNPMTQYPPRPTLTDEAVEAIVEVFVKQRPDFEEQLGPDSISEIASEYSLGIDGFELCKRLEKRCYWDTTREDMDILDELDFHVRKFIKAAEESWIEKNNIQPPYPSDTRVKVTRGNRGIGTIDSVCEYSPGKFLIKPDNPSEFDVKHNTRWVVDFEDVEPVEDEDDAA